MHRQTHTTDVIDGPARGGVGGGVDGPGAAVCRDYSFLDSHVHS